MVGASAHISDVTANAAIPMTYARLAPNRSERFPANSSSAAKNSVYPSRIHCCALVSPPRSAAMLGSARLTMLTSRVMRKNPKVASIRLATAPWGRATVAAGVSLMRSSRSFTGCRCPSDRRPR